MSLAGFGYIAALLFLAIAAFWTSPDKPLSFLDAHGGFMVFVGTGIVAILAVPWEYLKRFLAMIKSVMGKVQDDTIECLKILLRAAEKAKTSQASIKDILPDVKDLFLKDAFEILIEGFELSEIEQILHQRIDVQKERENSDAKMFKNLGKYPPAMGLIGTVMGMIALLGTLGAEGAETRVGPAMSVAMAATLYGVILANLIILPVADNLMFRTQKTVAKRQMILQGILLIKQGTSVAVVRGILLSHLSPHQRQLFSKDQDGVGTKFDSPVKVAS